MNNTSKRIWAFAIACVLCGMIVLAMGLRTTNSNLSTPEQAGNDQRLDLAIRKLWSADDAVRRVGHDEVLKIGSAAAVPLGDLLTDLFRDRRPRFASETEAEGNKALEAYIDLVRGNKGPVDNNEAFKTVSRLAINSRLISDAISLLGELKATEGVTILIRIMERHQTTVSEPIGIELEALRKIGSPAVPSLIKSIENARINASRAIFERPIYFGFTIRFDPTSSLVSVDDEESDAEGDAQTVFDPEEKWEIEKKSFEIKRKALQVLGDIGDETALPFLESLLKPEETKDWNIHPSIQAAIANIKHEPPSGSFPVSVKPKTPMEH